MLKADSVEVTQKDIPLSLEERIEKDRLMRIESERLRLKRIEVERTGH